MRFRYELTGGYGSVMIGREIIIGGVMKFESFPLGVSFGFVS